LDIAKPYRISKHVVLKAFRRVKANKGAAGVDGETIEEFERDVKNNLYKLWNRMSSGSYFPLPVRSVEIPKDNKGKRPLGIPTVADRVGQMVAKIYLEPEVEKCFHPDSYGYRGGKSATEAVGVARQRCFRHAWVVDLDIKGFFDNLDHELIMRAVRKHTECKWLLLYIERWLKAPNLSVEGTLVRRSKGTPQGSVISPLLANLFLHYAFDEWMRRNYPGIPFERYADDIIVHCKSEKQASRIRSKVEKRLSQCKLELNVEKTKIVYCMDGNRQGTYQNEKFDFLGYTFRARRAKSREGKYFIGFIPAVSDKAARRIRQEMKNWRLHLRSDLTITDLSNFSNPILRGWINYYGQYYRSALVWTFNVFNRILVKWAMRKYRKLRGHCRRAMHWLGRIARRQPELFAHWQAGFRPSAG
jgi:RNA-directed DNA polymerase